MGRSIPKPAVIQRHRPDNRRPGGQELGQVEPLLAGAAAVFHLAARPGVRTSFGPGFSGYLHDNVLATQRLLEGCVRVRVPRLVSQRQRAATG